MVLVKTGVRRRPPILRPVRPLLVLPVRRRGPRYSCLVVRAPSPQRRWWVDRSASQTVTSQRVKTRRAIRQTVTTVATAAAAVTTTGRRGITEPNTIQETQIKTGTGTLECGLHWRGRHFSPLIYTNAKTRSTKQIQTAQREKTNIFCIWYLKYVNLFLVQFSWLKKYGKI